MADDQNNSGKGPMNRVGNVDIEKIGQRGMGQSLRERQERGRASTAQDQINALSEIPGELIAGNPVFTRIAKTAPDNLTKAQNRIMNSSESRRERANNQAVNQIGRAYSEATINGQVRRFQEDPLYQNQALGMQSMSYSELSGRHDTLSSQLNGLGNASEALGRNLVSGRGIRKDIHRQLKQNEASAGDMTGEMASIGLAMKSLRQQGRDPLSRYGSLNASYASAQGLNSAREIGEELRGGGVRLHNGAGDPADTGINTPSSVKRGDIGSALASEAEKLAKIFEKLGDGTAKTAEDMEKLRKAAEETAGNYEKLKAAGGGPQGPSKSDYLNAGGQMFSAIGNGIQAIGVNQRLGQVANVSGYASIANQQYDMYKAGRNGDVMSQMMAGTMKGSKDFGASLFGWQQGANAAQVGGSALQTAAGVVQMAESGKDKVLGSVGGTLAGTSAIASDEFLHGAVNTTTGAVNMATGGMDMFRKVSAGASEIAGTQAQMDAKRAVLKVSAEQLQGVRDFSVGMAGAARSMGKSGQSFLQNSMSDGMMDKMVDSRLSPQQMAEMSQQGVSSMGSQFKTSQIFAARGLERTGNGTMQENMQRMSSLAGAGVNNPQAALGSVLEASFTKGLDNSKAITMMVENTAAMVAANGASTAAGINTAKSSANLLAANLDPNQKNQEFSVQRAMTAMEVTKGIVNDTSTSFAGQVNSARIAKTAGFEHDGMSAVYGAKIKTEELAAMRNMSEPNRKAALIAKGVDYTQSTKSTMDIVKAFQQGQVNQMATVGGGALGLGSNETRARNAAIAAKGGGYDQYDMSGKLLAARQGSNTGLAANEYARAAAGLSDHFHSSPNSKKSVNAAMKGEGGGAALTEFDNQMTSGAKQLAEAAKQASVNLGGMTKALHTLAGMSKEFEKMGASGAEGKFQTAAADAAGTFGKAATVFDGAVIRFSGIMDRAGLGKQSAEDKALEAKYMDQIHSAEKDQKIGRGRKHK